MAADSVKWEERSLIRVKSHPHEKREGDAEAKFSSTVYAAGNSWEHAREHTMEHHTRRTLFGYRSIFHSFFTLFKELAD